VVDYADAIYEKALKMGVSIVENRFNKFLDKQRFLAKDPNNY
jgi:hypothetical protein